MKKCLECNSSYSSSLSECQACSWTPNFSGDFPVYAPELACENSGFNPKHFSKLAALEESNFWFRARNKFIIKAISRYAPNFEHFFEIGCGTGYVLSALSNHYPNRQFSGGEIYIQGLSYAAARQQTSMNFLQVDARKIPFTDEFDCIGAFDVLEHIKEDTEVLEQIHHALKDKGLLILTVPQHQWLWTEVDKIACHVRRYSKKELHQKIEHAGYKIVYSTSFVSTLLPFMLVSRIFKKRNASNEEDYSELSLPFWLNKFFEKMMSFELSILNLGVKFPLGGSRLLVAKKVTG